jgi:anti-sigma B factor antagonist
MEIIESRQGDILILSIAGRLDSSTSQDFEDKLIGQIKGGQGRIVLDFDRLEYISSAGLRVLLKATRELKNAKGTLVLCAIKDYIQEVFELSGFASVFPIAPNLDGAMQKF